MTTGAGFASNFNNFLYAYLHAKRNNKPLHVYDLNSIISPNYRMLQETFSPPSDIVYTTTPAIGQSHSYTSMIRARTLSVQNGTLQKEAKKLFNLTPPMESRIQVILKQHNFPTFDLGVHIRSGDKVSSKEMESIPIDTYVKEIKANPTTKNVFVMTDDAALVDALKMKVPPSITIHSMSQTPCKTAHDQTIFNRLPDDIKLDAYILFLAELYVMQRIPRIVCTFSSNIGRYLYLTTTVEGASFKSLDMKDYVPL